MFRILALDIRTHVHVGLAMMRPQSDTTHQPIPEPTRWYDLPFPTLKRQCHSGGLKISALQ
jgi:hypothetical protein